MSNHLGTSTTGSSGKPHPRRVGFTTLAELRCPRGHHMKQDTFVLGEQGIRCKHREPLHGGRAERSGGGPECGEWVWILLSAGPKTAADEGGPPRRFVFVVETNYKELCEIEARHLDLVQTLDYFGVRFFGG